MSMNVGAPADEILDSFSFKTVSPSQIIGNDLKAICKSGTFVNTSKNLSTSDLDGSLNHIERNYCPSGPTGVPLTDNEVESHINVISMAAVAEVTDAAVTFKMKEERRKEREKRKEEELLKKYKAEQEAKQKVIGTSRCGRWLKNSNKIGEGGYKFVYRGYDREEARTIAWCEFKHEHVDTKEKRQMMFREIEIMLKMNHPHIVRCFDVFREWTNEEIAENPLEEKGLVIIQELMSEGTLKQVIRKNFLDGQCILKFQLITRWWHQIVDALRYMHHQLEAPIIHRDLKSENCFLYGVSDEEYLNVKVGDFGLATQVGSSGPKTMLGTVGFMAPEIFDELYDEKVDIYAFGMLMLEVMTNRAPYDECNGLFEAASKTMSGHGPANMQLITNPNLSVFISACIHPLACFRPTAEELYYQPLFQPKTIPVEVEANYEPGANHLEVIERFVRSLANPETRNPQFNLRLRFRDPKILQELGLDEGESLEFTLDIYRAENQDIPDLITSLRCDYEDKLFRAFANPKLTDQKIVSNHLDRLFNSIRMQMQFLVKCLLGKRWKDILDSLSSKERQPKEKPAATQGNQESKAEGAATVDSEEESDSDIVGCSNFEIIAKCKSKWSKAKRMLDREIQAYRKAAVVAESGRCALQISGMAQKPQQHQQQQQHQVQVQHQSSNPLLLPQPTGLTNASSAVVANAPESATNDVALPTSNLATEVPLNSGEDVPGPSQVPSRSTLFVSTAPQQPGFPSACVQAFPSHPASQPQGQPAFIRPSAQPVVVQSQSVYPSPSYQHQTPLINSLVADRMLQSLEIPSSLGVAGVHPMIPQNVQPPAAAPFPILVSSMEQHPAPVAAGLVCIPQQPAWHYPVTVLPSNSTLQHPQLQHLQQQGIGEERPHEVEVTSDTEAPECQRVTAPVGAKPKKKISQAMQVANLQPLPYIIRITRLERESEGCDMPDILRPTFYLEMPDVNNPDSELWKLSFRCNLSDTPDDIKLFEGCGYTQTNEEVDRAIKEAVAVMLRALQADENSILLNHDYVFYPHLSPELISASGLDASPIMTTSKEMTRDEVRQLPPPPATVPESVTAFESPHDVYLSNATSIGDSPIERNLRSGFTEVAALQPTLECPYSCNISPSINQITSASSYAGHSGLEEVPPINPVCQPENVCSAKSTSSFPAFVDSSQFCLSEPGNEYDSSGSLAMYSNAACARSMNSQSKEPDLFTTLKVPAHAQSLVAQFAHHLCTCRRNDPLLIVPSDANTSGYMTVLSENWSFLCSRNEVGEGFSVMPIPSSSSLLEVQNKPFSATQGRVVRAPHNGFIVVTPSGELHYAQRPLIILPGNLQRPLIELPLFGGDGSSIQLDDILALLINLREGMANASTSGPVSREHSITDAGAGTSQPQVRQQDINYYNLSCGATPMNSSRTSVPSSSLSASSVFTRQVGSRTQPLPPIRVASEGLSSVSHGDLSVTASSIHTPPVSSFEYTPNGASMQDSLPSQQQLLALTLNAFGLRPDQILQLPPLNLEYLAALLSSNPSPFLAPSAVLNANPSALPQQTPAVLTALQTPPMELLCNSSTSASSNSVAPLTASLSNADAFKQILFRAALENLCHQPQQQFILPPGVATAPIIPTVPSAPMHPGLFASTEIHDPNAACGKPIPPGRPTSPVVPLDSGVVQLNQAESTYPPMPPPRSLAVHVPLSQTDSPGTNVQRSIPSKFTVKPASKV